MAHYERYELPIRPVTEGEPWSPPRLVGHDLPPPAPLTLRRRLHDAWWKLRLRVGDAISGRNSGF